MSKNLLIACFEPDLIFSSKIEAEAAQMGAEFRLFDDLNLFTRFLSEVKQAIIIINLDVLQGKVAELQELINKSGSKSVGYYSHMNSALAAEASIGGVGLVYSRGIFVNRLGEILRDADAG